MCGIAAYLDATRGTSGDVLATVVGRMADLLRHRGPDDAGVWADEAAGIALAHRRLSIVDLSPLGHQPMSSADGRYTIAFNGEIYNHPVLRDELVARGRPFRGRSDTEVLLTAICEWGLEDALARANGMFAFALWDGRERVLHLVRDRLGEKPLYYAWLGASFVAASELKAMRAHPGFDAEISPAALALYLRHGFVPAPHSIYRRAFKLPPGTILTVSGQRPGVAAPRPYWTVAQAVANGVRNPWVGSARDAVDELDRALREAVRLRMHADVPLGAFLSGGIDSSTIVALMQAQSATAVKTFSIGFAESDYDEAGAAKAVAAHLSTDHEELYVAPDEALATIPLLPTLYDEPFADSSQIPTFAVSRLARRKVTVSLSGDGGDEVFGGYGRYLIARSLWRYVGWMPRAARREFSALLAGVPARWERVAVRGLGALLPGSAKLKVQPGRLRRLAEILAFEDVDDFYRALISIWGDPGQVASTRDDAAPARGAPAPRRPILEHMMAADMGSYLPDDILVKVDRASMGVSLEARVPFLDHTLIELAWRLPESLKVRGHVTKWILRQVLHRYVPAHLVERPKRGFSVPVGQWLRGPLRDWAQALLAEDRLRRQGFLDPEAVGAALRDHLSGARSIGAHLWTLLMFEAWVDATHAEARAGPPPTTSTPRRRWPAQAPPVRA